VPLNKTITVHASQLILHVGRLLKDDEVWEVLSVAPPAIKVEGGILWMNSYMMIHGGINSLYVGGVPDGSLALWVLDSVCCGGII